MLFLAISGVSVMYREGDSQEQALIRRGEWKVGGENRW